MHIIPFTGPPGHAGWSLFLRFHLPVIVLEFVLYRCCLTIFPGADYVQSGRLGTEMTDFENDSAVFHYNCVKPSGKRGNRRLKWPRMRASPERGRGCRGRGTGSVGERNAQQGKAGERDAGKAAVRGIRIQVWQRTCTGQGGPGSLGRQMMIVFPKPYISPGLSGFFLMQFFRKKLKGPPGFHVLVKKSSRTMML